MLRVSVSSFISGLPGGPSEKRFAQAIEKHDLTAMKKCLDVGVRRIDYIQWRDGDCPGQKVPAGKFHDPVKLVRQVGMKQEGMRYWPSTDWLTPSKPGKLPLAAKHNVNKKRYYVPNL